VRTRTLEIRYGPRSSGLLGANGAGKTTTDQDALRGLLAPAPQIVLAGSRKAAAGADFAAADRLHEPEIHPLRRISRSARTLEFYAGAMGIPGPLRQPRIDG